MQFDEDGAPLLPSVRRRETTPARMTTPRQLTNSVWQRPAPLEPRNGGAPGPAPEPYPAQGMPMYYPPYPMQYQLPPTYYQPYGPPYSQPYPVHFINTRSGPRSSTGSQEAVISTPRSRSRPADDRERVAQLPPQAPVVINNKIITGGDNSDSDDNKSRYSDDEIDVHVRRVMRTPIWRPSPPPRVRFDDGPDDIPSSTVYSFTPSRLSYAASTQPSMSIDDEPVPGKPEDDAGGAPRRDPDHAIRLSHISQSQYKGDHTLGGSHAVELTAALGSSLRYQHLFRWLHCTRTSMDFDEFSKEAIRVPNLTAIEQKGIRDLLSRVRRKFVKTVQTPDGRSVRHMEPACIQHILPPDSSLKGPGSARRTVTWVCLPYITLEKYSGLQGAPENPSAFPIETLLQAKFSRTDRERDMLQAVCQSKDIPGGLCYHVAQIWCLVVGNSLLFTYSRMTEETLRGDSISLLTEPTAVEKNPNARPSAAIAISHRQAILWSVPVDECHTWLDFLKHFREFWPQRLQFFHRKRPVAADNWPKVWNLAKHSDTKITLEMRIGRPPEPPPVGILVANNVGRNESGEPVPGPHSQPPPHPEDTPGSSQRTEGAPQNPGPTAVPVLAIFSRLPGVSDPKYDNLDEDALDDHFREVEDYILCQTTFGDRRAYTACPKSTRAKIYGQLEQRGVELSEATNVEREQQRDYEMQLDIFNAADLVFNFFFPSDVEIPTTGKFWGSLEDVINAVTNGSLQSRQAFKTTRSDLRSLSVQVQLFQEMFSQAGKQELAKVAVPKEIVQGWIHLLMALVYLPKDDDKSEMLLEDAKLLISSGMATAIHALSDKSLLDNSVFLPQELVTLLSLKLLQDSTLGMPDASQCYSACLQELAADIQSKPSDRSREYRISLLLEEIAIIQRMISAQTSVFESLMGFAQAGAGPGNSNQASRFVYQPDRPTETTGRRSGDMPTHFQAIRRELPRTELVEDYTPYYRSTSHNHHASHYSHYRDDRDPPSQIQRDYYYDTPMYNPFNPPEDFKLAPTDPDGFRVLLLNECLHFLAGRERDFSGFRSWASFLEKVNRNKIDTTKDRHDNAIYAFTIVTVVFLPLSAIASIFGMNTTDMRDMELGQWVYWAVALPVTALVIFLGLLWTGELGNIVGWVQSFGSQRHGYRSLVEVEPERFEEYGYGRLPPPPPPPRYRYA
ncbi:hypothetical protein B0T16DRAFT_103189 [Cercophora newfieldiana]|uniref:Mg2+ transporter n=1 Tax=Cercophora newfieldiana TaxID=92897 RepID=A0AA39YH56_9PEZI|nr:hypothetical protein B0T16DRAFT_103189 [Cercophora newfieldiana]